MSARSGHCFWHGRVPCLRQDPPDESESQNDGPTPPGGGHAALPLVAQREDSGASLAEVGINDERSTVAHTHLNACAHYHCSSQYQQYLADERGTEEPQYPE